MLWKMCVFYIAVYGQYKQNVQTHLKSTVYQNQVPISEVSSVLFKQVYIFAVSFTC